MFWDTDLAEVVPGSMPASAKEARTALLALADMVKADMKKGISKDWGSFLGESKGYCIDEGTEVEVMYGMLQYAPNIRFQVHPVATLAQVQQAIKTSMK